MCVICSISQYWLIDRFLQNILWVENVIGLYKLGPVPLINNPHINWWWQLKTSFPWWRYDMKMLSASLALCKGNPMKFKAVEQTLKNEIPMLEWFVIDTRRVSQYFCHTVPIIYASNTCNILVEHQKMSNWSYATEWVVWYKISCWLQYTETIYATSILSPHFSGHIIHVH